MEGFRKKNDKRMSLKDAIATFVKDGCVLAFGGFGGEQNTQAAYEIIRQKPQNLTVIGDSPSEQMDMLIGAGLVKKAEFAYCSYALAGLGHNLRRSVEKGIPIKVEVEEYSNYTMGLRYLAGAMNIPYMPTRSLLGSDLPTYNSKIIITVDPYERNPIALVPAVRPDVAIMHVNRCDQRGNVQMFGFTASNENLARAAKHTIITAEEIVPTEKIRQYSNLTVIPEFFVDAVAEIPFASHPWNMPYSYAYDIPFHRQQLKRFETREGFIKWLDEWVFGCPDHKAYCEKVGWHRLNALVTVERKFSPMIY
ncbi:MAG: CoA-transferase [Syntrophales bacterium]|jgi:glutaconate CoA-transferase subunit A